MWKTTSICSFLCLVLYLKTFEVAGNGGSANNNGNTDTQSSTLFKKPSSPSTERERSMEDFAAALVYIGKLQSKLAHSKNLLKKVGVFSYLRGQFELYEWIYGHDLDNQTSQSHQLTKEELEHIPMVDTRDKTANGSLIHHYNQWLNVFTYSTNRKIVKFKEDSMRQLNFTDVKEASKYIAASFCIVSNIGLLAVANPYCARPNDQIVVFLKYLENASSNQKADRSFAKELDEIYN